MAWTCHRVYFRSASDLAIGYTEIGYVRQTRLYIPGRNLWAASIEALAWHLCTSQQPGAAEFEKAKTEVEETLRFSYFYPWREGRVIVPWRTEPAESMPGRIEGMPVEAYGREFVRSALRVGTKGVEGTAEDQALFEHEFLIGRDASGDRRWQGYLWLREGTTRNWPEILSRFSIGGERRSGMGQLRWEAWEPANNIFGLSQDCDKGEPVISLRKGDRVFAHVAVKGCRCRIQGEIEPLVGRKTDQRGPRREIEASGFFWTPGSEILSNSDVRSDVRMAVKAQGTWSVLVRYVICYDIGDDRRREHVAHTLLDFGRRIQESVFVADLDGELAETMRERLKQALDLATDRVHIFHLCVECSAKAESMGGAAELPKDQDFYIL